MSRNYLYKLSLFIFVLFLNACATYDVQYDSSVINWKTNSNEITDEIDHTFYLIGDAGNAKQGESLTHFNSLKEVLSKSSKNSTVLFLGDNIYDEGLPKKNHLNRKLAEHRLDAQIELVDDYKGQTIFIPGNHDYYNDGIKGLEREANYIKEKLNDKNAFLPKNGCPLKKINLSDDLILIIIDTQWYLENWDKNPTMNDDCEIKSREQFFAEFQSLIKKSEGKTTIIALHHPMFTNGTHGGQFSLKQQLYPANNKVPLPILGTLANLLRKTTGASPQDLQNSLYRKLKNRIVTISQKSDKVIFVSGHEHNLQYLIKNNKPQIISGSGSKVTAVKNTNGSIFSYGGLGYAKLEVYKNGASQVSYYSVKDGKQELIFSTEVFSSTTKNKEYNYTSDFPKTVEASIYSSEETKKSNSYKSMFGEHYRKYYDTKVTAPTVLLDTLFGGLTPIRKGGGFQSRSLRLKNKDGKEYVMRALRKSATQFIQAAAFQEQSVEGEFDDTYTEEFLLDFYTSAHPYTPFIIGDLADAVEIFHTNPTLYYIPKQNALKHFNEDFGDELYMIEERTTSGHGDVKSFGFSDKLISTDDLLKKLRKSDNNSVDEDAYIKARLFDMLIGDWDRHQDQWRWAEFKNGKKKVYKPVPRDRDQAFSKLDGFLFDALTKLVPGLRKMQKFNDDIYNVKTFNTSPYPLDMALLNQTDYKSWEEQVKFIQKYITIDVIDNAFKSLPNEVIDETTVTIKNMLKNRLNHLPKIAKDYYSHLAKFGVVKGTDKDNWFEIERLPNGQTSIKTFNIKKGEKGGLTFEKLFSKDETKEIWIYALDDEDVFEVIGVNNSVIPLRLIGGQNNDTYIIESSKRVTIYDYKTKKNTFNTTKGKRKLFNNYEANTYNYKKLKYSKNQFTPIIGSNPDDGFKIGINNIYTVYGFERNPFTKQHRLNATYYSATKGFDIQYTFESANIFNKWNFLIETKITSPNYSINYFGFGNNTINNEELYGENYHRVKLSTYAFTPSLKWKGRMGAEFKVGASYEGIEVENITGRFINTVPNTIEKRKNYLGINALYHYENYDNKAFPTLGMSTTIETNWKTNTDDADENHLSVKPSISFDHKLTASGKIVFATKLSGNIIFGDNFEFYNAASIGGKNGLRGYRNQRFTGNQSFYQNTDIRFNLKKVKTRLIPLQIGLFGGFDYGKVWLDNEDSKNWKTSYGGGFWLVGADMLNLNFSLFDSKDGAQFVFGFGFEF
ncbi:MAG: phosphoesterase [Lutibacter sp.]|nr:MAG: phosphoesterase [Lutibacter sp.]